MIVKMEEPWVVSRKEVSWSNLYFQNIIMKIVLIIDCSRAKQKEEDHLGEYYNNLYKR